MVDTEFEKRLLEFDGVAVSILSEARAAFRDTPDYPDALIGFCIDSRPSIANGATWILKAEAEEGRKFGAELIEPLVKGLNDIPW